MFTTYLLITFEALNKTKNVYTILETWAYFGILKVIKIIAFSYGIKKKDLFFEILKMIIGTFDTFTI